MKKLISLLVLCAVLFSVATMLVSCGDPCKDGHTWNDGEVTVAPTQEKEGVRTLTCTVCEATKERKVAFTGMTEEEWNKAFERSVFENFTYDETAVVKAEGEEATTKTLFKFTKLKTYVSIIEADGKTTEQTLTGSQSTNTRSSMIDSILSMTDFEDYEYDASTKTYTMVGEIYMEALGSNLSTCSLRFEDGKLVEINYTATFVMYGIEMDGEATIIISDYGTTVVE